MTEDEYKIEIGKRIAEARKSVGLKLRELADRAGIKVSTLGMYEQGRRKPGNVEIIAIAKETGQDPAYLMCLSESNVRSAPQWLDPRVEKLPDMFKEAIRLKAERYLEMADKFPVSIFFILSTPTSKNYDDWERGVEAHYRSIVEGKKQEWPEHERRQAPDRRQHNIPGAIGTMTQSPDKKTSKKTG